MLGCVHEHDLVGVVGVGLLRGFRGVGATNSGAVNHQYGIFVSLLQ
jgi:hypothetical protein